MTLESIIPSDLLVLLQFEQSTLGLRPTACYLWLNRRHGLPPVTSMKVTTTPHLETSLMTETRSPLDLAAEEYALNPDSQTTRSGVDDATSVDPVEAFRAGARWRSSHPETDAEYLQRMELRPCNQAYLRLRGWLRPVEVDL